MRIILSGEIIPKMVFIQSEPGVTGALPKLIIPGMLQNTRVVCW